MVSAMTVTIRATDRTRDHQAIGAIDTTFETETVFDVVVGMRSLALVERALPVPLVKRYPMADAFSVWSTWDTGFVADVDGEVCGFAAVEYEAWHARLVLWHLYVTRSRRREGLGRQLLVEVEAHGRRVGARTVWLETSSVNVPGIAAYERLGYRLCGTDVTLYDTLPCADEAAIYLSKPLGGG